MKTCFYAINGHGLGHLSRSYAIAKRLNSLIQMIGGKPDIQILTTSEADYIVSDFPVFKIPSRSKFKGNKAAATRYSSNGKMMISSMLSHFSPDLLVMDTVATGSFNEFTFIKDFASKTAIVERHKNQEYSNSATHQSHLALYDAILIPEENDKADDFAIPLSKRQETHAVGRIHNFELHKALSRKQVREYFQTQREQKIVYLSAGGGGDTAAESQINEILKALKMLPVQIIIGFGPLSRSPRIYGDPKIVSVCEADIWRFFPGVDLAISAAGYNTYEELLSARVPSLFFAQEKGMDQQQRRIEHGLKSGWHGVLDLSSNILNQIESTIEGGSFATLSNREPTVGAIQAAQRLAELHYSNHQDTLVTLQMASITLELVETRQWQLNTQASPEEIFSFYLKNVASLSLNQRLRQWMEAIVQHEQGDTPTHFTQQLDLSEAMIGLLSQAQVSEPSSQKRLMNAYRKSHQESNLDTFKDFLQHYLSHQQVN